MQKQAEWIDIKNILCIRPDNLGDVLMTAPAIRALKESVPGRRITLLASSAGSSIAKFLPYIDEVIVFDPPWQGEHLGSDGDVEKIVSSIREKSFDGAVIFTVFSQNPLPAAMVCYMAGVPRVASYCRENPYGLVSDWLPDTEPFYGIRHEVVRQLDLVRMTGADVKNDSILIDIPRTAMDALPAKLSPLGIDLDKPWMLLHPGVSEARRQYPAELFAEVAERIASELDRQVLLTGVETESDLTGYIADIVSPPGKVFSVAGMLNLDEFIALINAAPLLVSNNTGPVHIAAATGTPVIVLYALTNPQHAPWKVKHKILPFDVPEEMRSRNTIINYAYDITFNRAPGMVSPSTVFDAVKEMLESEEAPVRTASSAL